jgi:hypothetical protein
MGTMAIPGDACIADGSVALPGPERLLRFSRSPSRMSLPLLLSLFLMSGAVVWAQNAPGAGAAKKAETPKSEAKPGAKGSGPKLPFADESAEDASLVTFLNGLRATVDKKDAEALRRVLSPNIQNSFGGDGGTEEFERIWKPDQEASPLWPLLEGLLKMGGGWLRANGSERLYYVPYVFAKYSEKLGDPFESLVILGGDVPLRALPADNARLVRKLSYDVVSIAKGPKPDSRDWQYVRLADRTGGYVSTEFVYSPVGFRAGFAKVDGQWQMVTMVSGD